MTEDTEAPTYTTVIDTPLGPMRAAARGNALVGLWFEESGGLPQQQHFPQDADSWIPDDSQPPFDAARGWLEAYFEGKQPEVAFELAPVGTEFELEVWQTLRELPYGSLATYGEIAMRIGTAQVTRYLEARDAADGPAAVADIPSPKPISARSIGQAVGSNPISIIIPCHRVVGAGGKITGYAGGLERKRALLELESTIDQITD